MIFSHTRIALVLVATVMLLSTSLVFAQTGASVDAQLEAELNTIAGQIDDSTSVDINVNALGTSADVSAQTGVATDVETEYATLFGDDDAQDGAEMHDDTMMEEQTGFSAFFSIILNFLFGWWN